jgi:hypothetical protein
VVDASTPDLGDAGSDATVSDAAAPDAAAPDAVIESRTRVRPPFARPCTRASDPDRGTEYVIILTNEVAPFSTWPVFRNHEET